MVELHSARYCMSVLLFLLITSGVSEGELIPCSGCPSQVEVCHLNFELGTHTSNLRAEDGSCLKIKSAIYRHDKAGI